MKREIRALAFLLIFTLLLGLAGCKKSANKTSATAESEGVNLDEEYAYKDIICDRTLTEGKMACYFFRSNCLREKPTGVTTSGDSTLLIAPDGTTMLIDTNLTPVTGRIVDYINKLGIKKLDYLMISHPDVDHYGGYEVIFKYLKVGELLINESPDFMNIKNKAGRCVAKAEELGIPCTKLHQGMTMDFGGVHMEILWPTEDYEYTIKGNSSAGLINGGSIIARFTYKKASFLFAGDLYVPQEKLVVEKYGDLLKTDIVKMSHHGLKTSNCEAWIKATNPKLLCGMVSVMKEDEVLLRYVYHKIPFTYSIFDGTCVVYTDGNGVYDVQVEKDRDNTYFGELNTNKGHFQIK